MGRWKIRLDCAYHLGFPHGALALGPIIQWSFEDLEREVRVSFGLVILTLSIVVYHDWWTRDERLDEEEG